MQKTPGPISLVVTVMFLARPSDAHHGISQFVVSPDLRLEGIVTVVRWENPHVYFEIDTSDESGRTEVWSIEGSSPDAMVATGLSRDRLTPGTRITITAQSHRDPRKKMARIYLLLTQTDIGVGRESTASVPEYRARDISGVWLLAPTPDNLATLEKFREPGVWWPITEIGRTAVETYTERNDSGDDCVPIPWPIFTASDGPLRIDIGKNPVILERDSSLREIHLNLDSHENAKDSILGHSIGHWEGRALVIDTTNFLQNRNGHGDGLPASPNKHLVERYELTDDPTRMIYSFWVDDPLYLTGRITGALEFIYRPDIPFEAVSCDSGNLAQQSEIR